ncbi:MAG TPA: thiamine pyrophosphate-dependent enzyme [Solirubrobacteraceae bacterium]|jgi:pyruvate dehydrogenase (quinone)|nr:thiamine pyrophosphate-dependent enzyme [Solirubrobacteraceae bacterium]
MPNSVADALWAMLTSAGVKRCYGIVGDALNPVIDALRRDGGVEFIQVRNEEAGVLAAVAEASLTGNPVAVCGTAGPGVMHLLNGLMDAQREGVPVIAIAGDTASGLIDSGTIEEINPYMTFQVASLYTGRLVNPAQTRTVVQTAIRIALSERGPTVIAVPGDVAVRDVPDDSYQAVVHNPPLLRPSDEDLRVLAKMIDEAGSVTIFGGDGCRDAHDEVVELAQKLQAPVGYAYRGKQWLEWGNPNAVGMTGLLGWGGAYEAMQRCDLCLLLGTNFPLDEFYPKKAKKVQVDRRPAIIGRRTHIDMGLVGDIKATVAALLPLVGHKHETQHLNRALKTTEKWRKLMSHYVTRGPELTPIRPEYLVSTIDELASDEAVVCADTGTACIWTARYVTAKEKRNILGSFSWASMANAMPNAIGAALAYPGRQVIGLCGDGGLSMLMGDLLTIAERQLPVKLVVLNNSGFQFVHIEMEEAGIQPYGVKFANPDLAKVAESIGLTGIRVEDPREVRDAVAELLATPGPALLDAVVEPYALSLPSHVSFGEAEGFSLSLAKQALNGTLDDVVHTVKANVHLV